MTQAVQAAVVAAPGDAFALGELEIGRPRADEVSVRIEAVGLCHTDLLARDGAMPTPLPAVLGHEGTGVVEAVGDSVADLVPGDRVVLSFDFCGGCRSCRSGRPSYCRSFRQLNFGACRRDGSTSLSRHGLPIHSHFFGQSAFASLAVVPRRCATRIDSEIPAAVLAPFGCGFQTGAGAVINGLRPPAGESIVVCGLGGVGMAAVIAAALRGCRPIVAVDPVPVRRRLAGELGATDAIDPNASDALGLIDEVTGGGAAFSLEMSGSTSALALAVRCLLPGGVCGAVGAPPAAAHLPVEIREIVGSGRTVRGMIEGDSIPAHFLPALVSTWEAGAFPIDRLIETFPFDRIEEAAAESRDGTVIKPVLLL